METDYSEIKDQIFALKNRFKNKSNTFDKLQKEHNDLLKKYKDDTE